MQQPRPASAPYHDPSVRFEPISPELLDSLPSEQRAIFEKNYNSEHPPSNNPSPSQPTSLPPSGGVNKELGDKIARLVSGEVNSIKFYEAIAQKAEGISSKQKAALSQIADNRKRQLKQLQNFFGQTAQTSLSDDSEPSSQVPDLRQSLNYAIAQESALLSEAVEVLEHVVDPMHNRAINMSIFRKIADLAMLVSM